MPTATGFPRDCDDPGVGATVQQIIDDLVRAAGALATTTIGVGKGELLALRR